jgi:dihydroorotase
MTRITFKGGTLVFAVGETRSDLVIEEGRVAFVGEADPTGTVIDASGLYVMPGMVDTHVHLMDPVPTVRLGLQSEGP